MKYKRTVLIVGGIIAITSLAMIWRVPAVIWVTNTVAHGNAFNCDGKSVRLRLGEYFLPQADVAHIFVGKLGVSDGLVDCIN